MGCADLCHFAGDHLCVVCTLELAGTRDNQKRKVVADGQAADI
jgi:hypothetical protein